MKNKKKPYNKKDYDIQVSTKILKHKPLVWKTLFICIFFTFVII